MDNLKCDQQGSLMQKTHALIKDCDLTLPELFKETGIPFYWLRQFKAGYFPNPSVNRVQYLYEYLMKGKLKV